MIKQPINNYRFLNSWFISANITCYYAKMMIHDWCTFSFGNVVNNTLFRDHLRDPAIVNFNKRQLRQILFLKYVGLVYWILKVVYWSFVNVCCTHMSLFVFVYDVLTCLLNIAGSAYQLTFRQYNKQYTSLILTLIILLMQVVLTSSVCWFSSISSRTFCLHYLNIPRRSARLEFMKQLDRVLKLRQWIRHLDTYVCCSKYIGVHSQMLFIVKLQYVLWNAA